MRNQSTAIQFRVADLLIWVTMACIGLAIERTLGGFALALACGLVAIATFMRLTHIESVMVGAVGGFAASLFIYQIAAAILSETSDTALFTAGCFAYLALGITTGMITVADHMIRTGQ